VQEPWWTKVHDAAQLLVSQLDAAVAHAARVGVYTPPPGSPPPRRRRRPASLRHLAEVIRSHRLAPGLSVDKDDVAGVLAGDLRRITDPVLVVAVARASHLIAGTPLADVEADRLVVAGQHVAALIDAARQADERALRAVPVPVPVPRVVAEPVVIDAYFTTRRPGRRRALIAGVLAAVVIVGAGALLVPRVPHGPRDPQGRQAAAPVTTVVAAVAPLEHAHARNDHLHARPLQDALDHGFTSFETDTRSFAPTYLRGLGARVNAVGGRVYPGYNQPVFLFVEITCVEEAGACKLPADRAAAAGDPNNPLVAAARLMSELVPYRGMLFHFDGTARRWGPVQIVVTGRHNDDQVPAGVDGDDSVRGLLSRQTDTYAYLDGSFGVDRDLDNADLVPVISFPNPAFDGNCAFNSAQSIQRVHWDDIIKAQSTGHHVRAAHLADCPDHSDSWTDALYAGVDYLSSDRLSPLGEWLTENAAGGGGGNCAVPSWIAAKRLYGQYCTLATGNVPVMSRPDPRSARVGSLVKGGAHWFLGQQPGELFTRNGTHNFWWAYTQAGNGQWGWVSLVNFIGAGPDQSADGLQYGCYDVRPAEPDNCHPV
jgi:hypothetical protein